LLKILFNLIKEDSGEILLNDGAIEYEKFIKEKASLINKNERSFFGACLLKKILIFLIACLNIPSSR
jgi:ABC-type multidrug transport system ATPase subunit